MKKGLSIILIFTCLLLAVSGCGDKKGTPQDPDAVKKITQNKSDSIAKEQQKKQEKAESESKKEDSSDDADEEIVEESDELKHYDVKPEIAAASFSDNYIQIGDMVFKMDLSMKYEDLYKLLENTELSINYTEKFDSNGEKYPEINNTNGFSLLFSDLYLDADDKMYHITSDQVISSRLKKLAIEKPEEKGFFNAAGVNKDSIYIAHGIPAFGEITIDEVIELLKKDGYTETESQINYTTSEEKTYHISYMGEYQFLYIHTPIPTDSTPWDMGYGMRFDINGNNCSESITYCALEMSGRTVENYIH